MRQPASRNEAFGDFGLAAERAHPARHLVAGLLVALSLFGAGAQCTTQWLAKALAYQPGLGKPLLLVHEVPFHWPWRAFAWAATLAGDTEGQDLARRTYNWLLLSAIFAVTSALLVVVRRTRRARNRVSEIHGSARWATRKDVERAGLLPAASRIAFLRVAPGPSRTGVVVGQWEDRGTLRYLRHSGPEHILAFAPTGSGKGVGLVLPTLLTSRHSALVLDPKGENFAKTSGWRASIGQRVYKLDFAANPAETAAFNPLEAIRIGSHQETSDVQCLARLIVDPDGKQSEGSNKHWTETSASLLTGAILHVLYRERAKSRVATLADVIDELSDRHRTHQQVLLDWGNFAHDPAYVQGWQDMGTATQNHPIVAATAREQLNREDKERAAVLSSAVTPLALFRDPMLAANTSRSDFKIEDLMDATDPITVYFVLRPSQIHRLRPIVRIVLDLALRRLVETMTFAGDQVVATHRHKLLLMLDEFPVLGKLDVFTEALAYIRGWEIKAYLITQDYEQLRATYGDRETISSNCQLKLAYAPNKYQTAKHLSQLTGTATVVRQSRSRSVAFGISASKRDSESEQEVARPLLTPDECMRLPGPVKRGDDIVAAGDMLVFCAGSPPIRAKQPLYFKDTELLRRSRIACAPARHPGRLHEGCIPQSTPSSAVSTPGQAALSALIAMTPSLPVPVAVPAPTDDELDDELMQLGLHTDTEEGHYDA